MERYKLSELFTYSTLSQSLLTCYSAYGSNIVMDLTSAQYSPIITFIASMIYGYFYDDLVAYEGEDTDEVKDIFSKRISYDVSVKLPYWFKKYNQIKKLLTTEDLSLLQTSKVVSSSNDHTTSASGSLQKTATTPTGVTTGTETDSIEIYNDTTDDTHEITTDGFADKYSNAQQKFSNASNIKGERSGTITREGSIDDLLNILEKLPSSFGDEITRELAHHFIFDYEGEERGYYNEEY